MCVLSERPHTVDIIGITKGVIIVKNNIKGKMIALEGSLRTGSYKDRSHPDVTHYTTEVYVENVEFCGSKADNNSGYNNTAPPSAEAQRAVQQAQGAGVETEQINYGNLSDFEEILSDGDVPF